MEKWQKDFYSNRSYLESDFPKKCKSCDRTYKNRKSFWEGTNPLEGEEQLSESPHNMIAEYRTCGGCGSCLIIRLRSLRDKTEEGEDCREEFDKRFAEMEAQLIPSKEARIALREEFSKIFDKGKKKDAA